MEDFDTESCDSEDGALYQGCCSNILNYVTECKKDVEKVNIYLADVNDIVPLRKRAISYRRHCHQFIPVA